MGTVIFQSVFQSPIECHCSIDPINLNIDMARGTQSKQEKIAEESNQIPILKKAWKYSCSDEKEDFFESQDIMTRPKKCDFEKSKFKISIL